MADKLFSWGSRPTMGNSTNSDEVASAANRHASLVYDCIDGNLITWLKDI